MGTVLPFIQSVDQQGYKVVDLGLQPHYLPSHLLVSARDAAIVEGLGTNAVWEHLSRWDAETRERDGQGTRHYRHYDAMRKPTAFREFAAILDDSGYQSLQDAHSRVLRFANRYGMLGLDRWVTVDDRPPYPRSLWPGGEDLHDWVDIIVRMKPAVRLWDMLRSGDRSGLRERFEWADDGCISYLEDDEVGEFLGSFEIASPEYSPELVQELQPGDVSKAAVVCIRDMINHMINRSVTHDGSVHSRLSLHAEPQSCSLSYFAAEPTSLLGALCLQFAQAVTEYHKSGQCIVCGRAFGYERKTKRFCSATCRKRFSRKGSVPKQSLLQGGSRSEPQAARGLRGCV